MFVINNKKIFITLSCLLVIASIISIFTFGLNQSIEFTGGSIFEVSFSDIRPEKVAIENIVGEYVDLPSVTIQTVSDKGFIIRTPFLEEENQTALLEKLQENHPDLSTDRISTLGSSIGKELKRKSLWAITFVIIFIILYIAFSFRQVSEVVSSKGSKGKISSWKYGIVAIVALIHDTIIPTGVFAVLGYYFGYQLDVLFITAILAILGYSVNDTIIVFDRIRENLKRNNETNTREDFSVTVGRSLSQTFGRSINTSFTTLLVILLLLFMGSEATRHFALVLTVGIIAGTYSSIFLASPLLVVWNKVNNK